MLPTCSGSNTETAKPVRQVTNGPNRQLGVGAGNREAIKIDTKVNTSENTFKDKFMEHNPDEE